MKGEADRMRKSEMQNITSSQPGRISLPSLHKLSPQTHPLTVSSGPSALRL